MKLRCLLLGKKAKTNLDSILNNRDITLSTKVHLVKAMVYPIVMYGCESWTIKKARHQRIDAFELWCWRRLLRAPWTARRSSPKGDQSCIFIGRNDAEAEAPILWPPDAKRARCWERLRAGEGDDRGWDGWMASLTQSTCVWTSSRRWYRTGKPALLQSMGLPRVGHDWATE